MKKDILCIDLDDTLSDTFQVIVDFARKYDIENYGGTGILKELVDSRDHYYFARMLNWNREQLISFFNDCYIEYLEEIKAKKNSSEVIVKLKNLGFSICILTARREKENGQVYEITSNWLKKNNIEYDNLIINSINKGKIVDKMKAKIFIDDSFDNCLSVRNCSPSTKVYLMDTVCNSCIDGLEEIGIERIHDLPELYNKVRSLRK